MAPRTSRISGSTATIVGVILLGIVMGPLDSTNAAFQAATENATSEVATASLAPATAPTATLSGADVEVTWSSGSMSSGDPVGHRLRRRVAVEPDPKDGLDGPTTCDGSVAFPNSPVIRLATDITSYLDVGVSTTAVSGSYRCYEISTEYPAAPTNARWTTVEGMPVAIVQVGSAVKTLELIDGGTPGLLRAGDQFRFTFIQPIDTTTGPTDTNGGTPPTAGNDICVQTSNSAIVVGRTSDLLNVSCTQTNTNVGGRVRLITMTGAAARRNAYRATYAWTDCLPGDPNACRTMTATLGDVYLGVDDVTATAAVGADLIPSTVAGSLLSAEDALALCNGANSTTKTCRPLVTGSL